MAAVTGAGADREEEGRRGHDGAALRARGQDGGHARRDPGDLAPLPWFGE